VSGVDDLVRWLGEQLDEDERIVGQALDFVDADWRVDATRNVVLCPLLTGSGRQSTPVTAERWRYPRIGTPGLVPHVAEHDPARVLREIEAKRQVLALHSPSEFGTWVGDDDDQMPACSTCGDLTARFPCKTLRLLASVYSDRPGFRPEWAADLR
jgi:hypothetical protein